MMQDTHDNVSDLLAGMQAMMEANEYVNVLLKAATELDQYNQMVKDFQKIMHGKPIPTGITALAVALADALMSHEACISEEELASTPDGVPVSGKPADEKTATMMFAAIGKKVVTALILHKADQSAAAQIEESGNADESA
jgi:hypothetical protein